MTTEEVKRMAPELEDNVYAPKSRARISIKAAQKKIEINHIPCHSRHAKPPASQMTKGIG